MMIDAKIDRNEIHQHAGAELGQSHLKLELELSLAMETEILTLLKFQPNYHKARHKSAGRLTYYLVPA